MYLLMFSIIYPISAVVYTLLIGPLGVVAAWYSIYQHSNIISRIIVTIILLPHIQKVAYEAVLSRESKNLFVRLLRARNGYRSQSLSIWSRTKSYLYDIWRFSIFPMLLPRMIILCLISFIPIIGPILVFYFRVTSKGFLAHRRYFILKGYHKTEMKQTFRANRPSYIAFGLSAILLEMIPWFDILFMFTNTIAAALWAVDIENKERQALHQIEDECIVELDRESTSF